MWYIVVDVQNDMVFFDKKGLLLNVVQSDLLPLTLGKLVTEKPVDLVGFDNVVEFNKNRQNDDNVVKAYKDLFS